MSGRQIPNKAVVDESSLSWWKQCIVGELLANNHYGRKCSIFLSSVNFQVGVKIYDQECETMAR